MDRTTEGNPAEWTSGLVDLSEMSLEQLQAIRDGDDSPLARSLRRVTDELAEPDEPIAGFNSAL